MNRAFFRPALAALSLALAAGGMSAAAHASQAPQDPVQAQARADKDGPRHHKHHLRAHKHGLHHAAAWIPGVGPLPQSVVDGLKLDDQQKAQLERARAASKALRTDMRGADGPRKVLADQLAAGQLDPRALITAGEQRREQMRDKAKAAQENWLAFWDGLSAEQRSQVADFVKKRQARMAERHAARVQAAKSAN